MCAQGKANVLSIVVSWLGHVTVCVVCSDHCMRVLSLFHWNGNGCVLDPHLYQWRVIC